MRTEDDSLRVLLISDDRGIRSTLKDALRSEDDIEVAGEVRTVEQVSDLIRKVAAEVVVLHLGSDERGPDQVQLLRAEIPDARVVAISAITDPVYVERVLRSGALGFLTGSSAEQEIGEAVRSVAVARAYVNRRVARKILSHLLRSSSDDPHEQLTRREREVFNLMGTRNTAEIADGLGLSIRTVRGYIRSIRAKLDLPSTSDLVEYARQRQAEQAKA